LSVAVVVDDRAVLGPEGQLIRQPWSEQDLARFTRLVQDAVGFSASRGDSVSVINAPFTIQELVEEVEPPFYMQEWFWDIMKQVLGIVFILVLVFGVLKPLLNNAIGGGSRSKELALGDDKVKLGDEANL